jgi:hypothetical protein
VCDARQDYSGDVPEGLGQRSAVLEPEQLTQIEHKGMKYRVMVYQVRDLILLSGFA